VIGRLEPYTTALGAAPTRMLPASSAPPIRVIMGSLRQLKVSSLLLVPLRTGLWDVMRFQDRISHPLMDLLPPRAGLYIGSRQR
jgi:hypothetical protein